MARQTINIGTTANDGTGDPLRTAFDKINDNFTELYSETAADSQITISGNKIKTNVSNADLVLDTNGTGLVDFETGSQDTVGAVGAASKLPLDSANEVRPVGYLKIKVNGTEYVVPYFNAS